MFYAMVSWKGTHGEFFPQMAKVSHFQEHFWFLDGHAEKDEIGQGKMVTEKK